MYVCMYVLFPVTMDVLGESYVLKGMAGLNSCLKSVEISIF